MKKQNNWKIIKRKFTAFKYEKGSPERNRLNKSSITSEFAKHLKYLVVDENQKPLKSFKTKSECYDFIKNPDKYKPKHKIKKYNPTNFIIGRNWYFQKRKRWIKN